jgi:diguanylate cyclase (GGDEF)-like protein
MEKDKDQIIKRLNREIKELKKLSVRDHLTGVLNRRGFLEEIDVHLSEINYNKKHQRNRRDVNIRDVSVIFVDIDDLKKINDKYGHDVGDMVLRWLIIEIEKKIRKIDLFGRWGGDELVLALIGSDENSAHKKIEAIRKHLGSQIISKKCKDLRVTISSGVVSVKKSGVSDSDALILMADRAMYEAKLKRSKNCTVKYSEIGKK